ncbi:styrene-oxide isomerase StyC [Methylibium sp.]|uniref:styrene-oxide isomerase StyC n=1 Tax=Methylibium sp. TaxID=2067992 RepID=UPI003D0CB59D
MLSSMQKQWFGHGVLMILATLLGGVGLWMFLVGGFEIVPGYILHFQLPGSAEGWRRAHGGPALNGLMVIAVALVLPALNFSERKASWLGWLVVADGWANVVFYFFSNLSPNRGLSFGPNVFGEGNVYSAIALAPAYLFGVIAVVVLAIIGWEGIRSGRSAA